MSNYVKSVNFASKDALASGNPSKLIRGTELNTEYDNIATAVATKEDTANKNVGSGYAGLDANARISSTAMPALTGDVTTTAGAVTTTIAASVVTNAKLAASVPQNNVLGRITASTGNPEYLTPSNLITVLNTTSGLATSVITSGTFANALIAVGNVTQHQGSLSLATSQITSGTFADARIASSNVTQYQGSLSIATSQLTGNMPDARIIASNVTQHQASISISTSQVTSGTFADARIASSNVTQYQSSFKGRNITGKSGTSFTIQSGGSASGGSDGDIIGIY